VALAKYSARGKQYLVMVHVQGRGLVMQQLRYADEVKPISEVPLDETPVSDRELDLAMKLIDQIATDQFEPEKYEDEVRKRVEKLIAEKLKGKDITARTPAEKPPAEVIDLMEALKASLARKGKVGARATARRAAGKAAQGRAPRKGSRRRSTAARRSTRLAG
jgi:DNA end-binding protein Ku